MRLHHVRAGEFDARIIPCDDVAIDRPLRELLREFRIGAR
jgi:hypothetical protein